MELSTTIEEKPNIDVLNDLREFFAAGYLEEPEASAMQRWSRAVRRRFEKRALHPYNGELLYPCRYAHSSNENQILMPGYSFTWSYNGHDLLSKMAQISDEKKNTLEFLKKSIEELEGKLNVMRTRHTIGGRGYTHSIPNYGRVLREGLSQHAIRIEKKLDLAQKIHDEYKVSFYLGLLDVLEGIKAWHARILEMLKSLPKGDADFNKHLEALITAFQQVPFQSARNFYEAVVAYNFVYYLDDCDNPGRIDQELFPYYENDLVSGLINHEKGVKLVRCFWENVDANSGWSAGIGGTSSTGEAGYNELTIICLEAARKIRRPNLQLHVRKDMPQEVWKAALDTIATGCGLPALYNEEGFLTALRDAHLGIREEDLGLYNGGGCTETMIHGCSNVGSLDAGINLPLILVQTLNEHLADSGSFDDLMREYKEDVGDVIWEIVKNVNADQEIKSKLRPQPMRSLLIDDCIDNGLEFNAGGARYNWSVINVAGLANVIDSMAALEEVVFGKKEKTGAEVLEILKRNYEGEEGFRRRLEKCPRFGNDSPKADNIAKDIANFVFREFLAYAPWRGGKFLASCLMFVTYADAGVPVSATPDGRLAGSPLADSAGPVQGRDRKGPTAMLKSVSSIPHYLAPGTLVINARFMKEFFITQEGRDKIQDLIKTYFEMGGMQIQINVVDQKVLKDAIEYPEKHQDLIIRIGGYSEYFNRLSPALKQTVLERIEHGL